MFRTTLRTFGVAIGAILLTVGFWPAANAANVSVSNGNGYIEFIDAGDHFKVCDTRVNGEGVTGFILYNGSIVAAEDDGGDAGCDSFTFNLITGLLYEMKICDKGYSNCKSKWIGE